MSCRNNHNTQYNSGVKALCNRALVSCGKKTHNKCKKKTKASLIRCGEINIFLVLILVAYGTKSREGITIQATAMEDDKEYQVYPNFKQQIKASQISQKRKSNQLNPSEATAKTNINSTTCGTTRFAVNNDGTVE